MSSKKLNSEEWKAIRLRWQTDPRMGFAWLVEELNLPVGRNALVMRAKREGWAKSVTLNEISNKAHLKADHAFSGVLQEVVASGVALDSPEIVTRVTNEAIDLRTHVIETHRQEWNHHRKEYGTEAFMQAERTKALKAKYGGAEYADKLVEDKLAAPIMEYTYSDLAKFARCAKLMAETIKIRQEGERKAWGLDASNEDTTAGMETEEQLNARYEAFMMQHRKERKQRQGANPDSGNEHILN